jgi:hypothetical protein
MNTDQRFNNPNINHGTRVYSAGVGSKGPTLERLPDIKNIYIFFPMAVATLPATMDKTKPLQNTPANIIHHQKQTKYIYIFFPTGRCSGLHKTRTKKKKKTTIEIYEGTACVGYPTRAVLPPTRKLL